MIEIYFGGQLLFEFKDSGFLQLLGLNEELKRLIVDIYYKIHNGYRFSDVDMETMNGYYPEIKQEGNTIKKSDDIVIKLTDVDDIVDHLSIKNDSIFLRYLISLNDEMAIIKALAKVEESLISLSIELDKMLENKVQIGDLSLNTCIDGVELKKILKSFIDINFVDQYNQRKTLWLLKDKDIIDLFLNYTRLLLEKNNNITIIVDGIDARIGLDVYMYYIENLYLLSEEFPNLRVWLIPKTEKGIWVNYDIFDNTYILGDEIISLRDFDITYESICRNYPDNNLPTKFQVLESILRLFPFHYESKAYLPTKETVILHVFLKLLDINPGKIKQLELSRLETNFLTSINR